MGRKVCEIVLNKAKLDDQDDFSSSKQFKEIKKAFKKSGFDAKNVKDTCIEGSLVTVELGDAQPFSAIFSRFEVLQGILLNLDFVKRVGLVAFKPGSKKMDKSVVKEYKDILKAWDDDKSSSDIYHMILYWIEKVMPQVNSPEVEKLMEDILRRMDADDSTNDIVDDFLNSSQYAKLRSAFEDSDEEQDDQDGSEDGSED